MVLYPYPRGQLLLEEVPLVEEDDERLGPEVDVVHHGVEQVEALLHPVDAAIFEKNLEVFF